MHLTNYSVNKYNVDYEITGSSNDSEKTGSKRSLKFLFEYLRSQNRDATTLWKDIQVRKRISFFLKRNLIFLFFKKKEYSHKNCISCSTTFIFCISNVSTRCISI